MVEQNAPSTTPTRGGKPLLNTDTVRGLARSTVAQFERHNASPGRLVRDTVPALCDEVDYLRAALHSVEALADEWSSETENVEFGLDFEAGIRWTPRGYFARKLRKAIGEVPCAREV